MWWHGGPQTWSERLQVTMPAFGNLCWTAHASECGLCGFVLQSAFTQGRQKLRSSRKKENFDKIIKHTQVFECNGVNM